MQQNFDGYPYKFYQTSSAYLANSGVTLSQRTSRFWLPFDVKMLEILTPKDYLEKYCRVNHRRNVLYKRVFDKYRDTEGELTIEFLFDALSDTYMDTMDRNLIQQVISLLNLPSNVKITFAQFRGIAAFSERYFFNIFRRPDDINSESGKDILEILDFSSLKWKLLGVNVSPALQDILRFI